MKQKVGGLFGKSACFPFFIEEDLPSTVSRSSLEQPGFSSRPPVASGAALR